MILPPPPFSLDLYIGTYTDAGGGKGIYRSRLDLKSGALTTPTLAIAAPSPSYLALAPDGRTLYAVHESEATVGAYGISPDRSLRLLNVEPSRGAAPCHLALDPKGRTVFVANYGGSLAAFPVRRDGMLAPAGTVWTAEGSGPNPNRQKEPHLHSVGVDPLGRFLHACDLGTDEVLTFRLGEKSGEMTLASRAKVPAGSGPRHFALGPGGRMLYANNELRPSLTTFARDSKTGVLTPRTTLSTLGKPPAPEGANSSEIALHPNGRWLYVSNRIADTIAFFKLDKSGTPTFVEVVPAGVVEPRGFGIDPTGRWLVAAGQRSNTLLAHRIDPKTGQFSPGPNSVSIGKPACVVFARMTP